MTEYYVVRTTIRDWYEAGEKFSPRSKIDSPARCDVSGTHLHEFTQDNYGPYFAA